MKNPKVIKPTSEKLIPKNEIVINDKVTIEDVEQFVIAFEKLSKKIQLHPVMINGIKKGLAELQKKRLEKTTKKIETTTEKVEDKEKPESI